MADELLAYRDRFPILANTTYMISNSLGAMPRAVYDSMKAYADKWATDGVLAWYDWLPMVVEVGDLVGEIIGAPKSTVMMHQNVSNITAMLISALDFSGPRNKVVYSDLNFTTVHYNWMAAQRRGARVHVVKSPDGIHVPMEAMLEAIDEQTLAVPISHCLFRSSYLYDVEAVVARAHEVGAIVILDAYQSAGSVPIDVKALNVDFVIGGSVKWLCGGPGAGYCYVREDLITRYEPMMTGWFSHKRPFAFEMDAIDYATDIHRFMGGSPSIPALYAAREGYKIILEAGVDRIREKSLGMTRRLIEGAKERGFPVNSPEDDARRGGTVVIDVPDGDAVHHELVKRRFLVDYRPSAGIRISPHFYNSIEECDAILAEISKITA